MADIDVVAALRPAAVEVELDGYSYEIPPLAADVWIEAVVSNDAFAILPGLLCPEDEDDILGRLADDGLELDEIRTVARHALGAASGRDWWEAQHLILGAANAWDSFGGALLLRGVDLTSLSIAAFCSMVYSLATRDMDKGDRLKFDMDIKRVPLDAVEEEGAGEEGWAAAFRAALAEQQRIG